MVSRVVEVKQLVRAMRRESAGQALVEAAITIPLLMLLLVGAVELARVAYAAIEVSNAARAAATYGAQDTSTVADSTGMGTVAANDAANLTGLTTTTTVTGICSDGSACTGSGNQCLNSDCSTSRIEQIVTVKTQVAFNPAFHLPGLPTSFTLTGRAQQKCLHCY